MGCSISTDGKDSPAESPIDIQTAPRRKSVKFKDPPADIINPPPIRPVTSTRHRRSDGPYPPRPPRSKRKDVIPDDSIFKDIDEHALRAPRKVETSIDSLYKYLVQPTKSDLERCRVFYRWITNNIAYDTAALFQGKKKPVDSESVLKLRTLVCAGYANLFASLCQLAGILVEKISGYSKGYNYDPEVPYEFGAAITHSWNAVYIDGNWRFIECTWGAGSMDENKKYHFDFKDHHFLTDPDIFVQTHFPFVRDDTELTFYWQLLEHPWSLEEFNKNIKPSSCATEWGIEFISHKICTIFVNGTVDIVLKCSKSVLQVLSADISPEKGDRLRNYTFIRKSNDNEFSITVRPPKIGKYKLRVLGSLVPQDDNAEVLVQYVLKCINTDGFVRPFPYHWGIWGLCDNYQEMGVDQICDKNPVFIVEKGEIDIEIPVCKYVEASCRLVHAEDIVRDSDDYTMVEYTDKKLHIKSRLPKEGYYKLQLLLKNIQGNYKTVLNYMLDCRNTLPNCRKLPKCYKAAREYSCRLKEPLGLELPRNSSVQIKLISPQIEVLSLKKHLIKDGKEGDEWDITASTPNVGEKFILSGSGNSGVCKGLYEFIII